MQCRRQHVPWDWHWVGGTACDPVFTQGYRLPPKTLGYLSLQLLFLPWSWRNVREYREVYMKIIESINIKTNLLSFQSCSPPVFLFVNAFSYYHITAEREEKGKSRGLLSNLFPSRGFGSCG